MDPADPIENAPKNDTAESREAGHRSKSPIFTQRTTAENSTDEEEEPFSPVTNSGGHPIEAIHLPDAVQSQELQPAIADDAHAVEASTTPGSTLKTTQSTSSNTNPDPAPDARLTKQHLKNQSLASQISQLEEELLVTRAGLSNPDAGATIAQHIKLLHEYNGIRDVGLGLMGMVADRRRVRVGEVMSEFGVAEGN